MSFTAVASQAPETHSSNVVRIDIQDLIRRIHADYTILDGIPDSVARELLQNIHEYPVRSVLMEEWPCKYPCFYILLRGKVEISTQECGVITELSGFQILGECGFTGESRTATVAVKERAYAIQILSSTIERFSPQIQLAFYKNLARESSRKIGMANKIITRKTPEKSRRVPAAVRQRVEHIM